MNFPASVDDRPPAPSGPVRILKRYAATSRGQLHVRECGRGTPLVLLQILPFAGQMFEPIMPVWAQLGYRCVAVDLMGYGGSDRRTTSWQVADFSDNVLEALETLSVEPRYVLGGHFGAQVAIDMAIRFPNRVEKVVLDGVPAWGADERERRRAGNNDIPVLDPGGSVVAGLWSRVCRILSTADDEARLQSDTEAAYLDAYGAFLRLAGQPPSTEAFFGYPTLERLAQIIQPVLVVGSPTDTLRACHHIALEMLRNGREYRMTSVNPLYCLTRPPVPGDLAAYATAVHQFLQDA